MYINPTTFRRWWDLFRTDAPLTEIRLIGSNGKIASGYFYDCETALKCIQEYRDESKGLYACLNVIDSSCDGCSQRDKIIDNPKVTTNDKDIKGRIWVLIDIDTDRKSDSNATDAQVKEARDMVRQIGIFLRDQGFSSPIVAMSANGYHMYYRVNIACNEETDKVIADFLAVLEMRFGTDTCHVDLSVKNRSRVAKIIGSKSNKGSDTIDRPQRESYFEKVPEDIEPTDIAFFRKVASYLPQDETPSRHNNYSTEAFDLDGFISKHGLRVARIMPFQGGQRYILEECPFCSDHKAPDAALFKMQSGAVGFKCLHNSCSHNSWRDVRILFEPDAYTKREYDEFKSRQDYYSTAPKQAPTILKESAEKGKKWLSMTDIAWVDPSQFTYIPTGFEEIDRKMGGMCLGDVTVMTGRPGAGKTSILNSITLNAIQRGYKVAVWSGELQASRFQSWIDQVAAGINGVEKYKDWWVCKRDVAQKIHQWLNGKLWLRNNAYKNKWSQLKQDIIDCVTENGTQLVILDNLASMNLDNVEGAKNDKQSVFIAELKEFAKESNIHIVIVIHPRKDIGNGLMRLESISGAADLYGLCDNVLLLHRVCQDFERRGKEFWGAEEMARLMVHHEIVEVAKNRSHGLLDDKFGLYFIEKTRAFKSSPDDAVPYGWADDNTEQREPHYNQESREVDDPLDPFSNPPSVIPF